MKIHVLVLWVATPYSVAVGYQRFGVRWYLHLQVEVKMETTRSSKMFISYYISIRHYIPQDHKFILLALVLFLEIQTMFQFFDVGLFFRTAYQRVTCA
jgi:hypothetical protein